MQFWGIAWHHLPLACRSIIEHVARVLQEEGSDSWWSKKENDLLPPALVEELQKNGKSLPKKVSPVPLPQG